MDTNLILRDGTTNLTTNETLTTCLIGPMVHPLWLHVLVPQTSASDTLDVELEFCAAAASTTQISNANMKQIAALGLYSIPFFTAHEYVQVMLVVAGTSIDWGAVKVWIAPAHRYDSPFNA